MLSKKLILTGLIGLISLGVLGLMIFGYNYYQSKKVVENVEHFRTEIENTHFMDEVTGKFKTEGINPDGLGIGISANGEKSFIIYFSNHQPDEVQFKAQRIVKEVSQKNKLGDFKVELKKLEPSQFKDPDL